MKASLSLPSAAPLPRPARAFVGAAHRWLPRAYPLVGALFGGFATVALLVTMQGGGAPLWAVNAAMLTPGVVCAVLIPSSRRRAYRWLVLLALAQVVYPWVTAPLLLFGTTWALWRTWIERPATVTADAPRSRQAKPAAQQKTGAR